MCNIHGFWSQTQNMIWQNRDLDPRLRERRRTRTFLWLLADRILIFLRLELLADNAQFNSLFAACVFLRRKSFLRHFLRVHYFWAVLYVGWQLHEYHVNTAWVIFMFAVTAVNCYGNLTICSLFEFQFQFCVSLFFSVLCLYGSIL